MKSVGDKFTTQHNNSNNNKSSSSSNDIDAVAAVTANLNNIPYQHQNQYPHHPMMFPITGGYYATLARRDERRIRANSINQYVVEQNLDGNLEEKVDHDNDDEDDNDDDNDDCKDDHDNNDGDGNDVDGVADENDDIDVKNNGVVEESYVNYNDVDIDSNCHGNNDNDGNDDNIDDDDNNNQEHKDEETKIDGNKKNIDHNYDNEEVVKSAEDYAYDDEDKVIDNNINDDVNLENDLIADDSKYENIDFDGDDYINNNTMSLDDNNHDFVKDNNDDDSDDFDYDNLDDVNNNDNGDSVVNDENNAAIENIFNDDHINSHDSDEINHDDEDNRNEVNIVIDKENDIDNKGLVQIIQKDDEKQDDGELYDAADVYIIKKSVIFADDKGEQLISSSSSSSSSIVVAYQQSDTSFHNNNNNTDLSNDSQIYETINASLPSSSIVTRDDGPILPLVSHQINHHQHHPHHPYSRHPSHQNSRPIDVRRQQSVSSIVTDRDNKAPSSSSSEAITAESFILLVKYASGSTADIDNSFLDRYVYRSGVLFLRYHVSVTAKFEGKSRMIQIKSEQIGLKFNGEVDTKKYANKVDVLLRIAESRDDMMTEPTIQFSNSIETYEQTAFSKPGRKAGFRRNNCLTQEKLIEYLDLNHDEIEEINRIEMIYIKNRTTLQYIKEIDHPIKYTILDPNCFHLCDIMNTSADSLLIEQLYTNFYELNIIFQCQSIRSMGRSISTTTIPPINNYDYYNNNNHSQSKKDNLNEKSSTLQFKVLSDCILGNLTRIKDDKYLDGTQFNIYIRCEAIYAIALYQNEIAPKSLAVENYLTKDSSSWSGLKTLINILTILFIDPITKLPLPNDFNNETSTYLRNSLLLSLSIIRAQNSYTPYDIIEILLLFASYNNNDSIYRSNQNEYRDGTNNNDNNIGMSNNNTSRHHHHNIDDTHYKSILLLALSNVQFENISNVTSTTNTATTQKSNHHPTHHINSSSSSNNNNNNSSSSSSSVKASSSSIPQHHHPIHDIISLAKSTINNAFTQARSIARIKYNKNKLTNYLPSLHNHGLDVCAAISCLTEMDIQVIQLLINGRYTNQLHLKDIDRYGPTGIGIITNFEYLKYILPPNTKINTVINPSTNESIQLSNQMKDKLSYYLCNSSIKATAFEGFVRICFALHYAYHERAKNLYDKKETMQSTNAVTAISTTISSNNNSVAAATDSSSSSSSSMNKNKNKNSNENNVNDNKAYKPAQTIFIAATIEVYSFIMKNEVDNWLKKQVTMILCDVIMDRPSRISIQAISMSNYWFCHGYWSDPYGYTITPITGSYNHHAVKASQGKIMLLLMMAIMLLLQMMMIIIMPMLMMEKRIDNCFVIAA